MKRKRMHIDNACLFIPPLVGPAAIIAWQEGARALAVPLGVAFVALMVIGALRVRVYWVEDES